MGGQSAAQNWPFPRNASTLRSVSEWSFAHKSLHCRWQWIVQPAGPGQILERINYAHVNTNTSVCAHICARTFNAQYIIISMSANKPLDEASYFFCISCVRSS